VDYRELENRMQRNQDLIKERAYLRLVKEAKKANKANKQQGKSWFASLRSLLVSLTRRKVEPQPQPVVELKPQQPQRQIKQH
jgi:hypothetical protein